MPEREPAAGPAAVEVTGLLLRVFVKARKKKKKKKRERFFSSLRAGAARFGA